jgi:xanthine dehydrogenase small subunit
VISSSVKFLLNDKLIEIKNPDPNQTLLNYIRTELKKTGTKEGCSEGGCGACTIVLGELVDNKIVYKAINSCISFVPSLNGKQLIIVEDLVSENGKLHPVQDAMVKFHGSQCGFCTPGFVMSLFSMFKNNKSINNELITDSISGNLCRCTGYRPIIDAAKSLNKINKNDQFSKNKNKVIQQLKKIKPKNIYIKKDDKIYFSPKNIKDLKGIIKKHSNFSFLAGGTDLSLKVTKERKEIPFIIDLKEINELDFIK